VLSALSIVVRVVTDLIGWVALAFQSRQSLQAEVLFLRRQLALYVERGVKPMTSSRGHTQLGGLPMCVEAMCP
jgi:hypothetical protein